MGRSTVGNCLHPCRALSTARPRETAPPRVPLAQWRTQQRSRSLHCMPYRGALPGDEWYPGRRWYGSCSPPMTGKLMLALPLAMARLGQERLPRLSPCTRLRLMQPGPPQGACNKSDRKRSIRHGEAAVCPLWRCLGVLISPGIEGMLAQQFIEVSPVLSR